MASKKQTHTDSLVEQIKATNIPMTIFAKESGIKYARFVLIVRRTMEPTYEEAIRIKEVIPKIIKREIDRVELLKSKYAHQL